MFDFILITLTLVADIVIIILGRKYIDEGNYWRDDLPYIGAVLCIGLLVMPVIIGVGLLVIYGLFMFIGWWLPFIVVLLVLVVTYVFWTPIKEWIDELEVDK